MSDPKSEASHVNKRDASPSRPAPTPRSWRALFAHAPVRMESKAPESPISALTTSGAAAPPSSVNDDTGDDFASPKTPSSELVNRVVNTHRVQELIPRCYYPKDNKKDVAGCRNLPGMRDNGQYDVCHNHQSAVE